MKRLGIMGGTFNPIHNGHIEIAKAAYEQYSLEQVLFLPSKKPPHKRNRRIAANKDRIEMVTMAIRDYPYFALSTCEMDREGYSYTSDTLKQLKAQYPDYELYFIVGADSLHYMEEWHEPETIFSLSHILCAPRFPLTKEEDYKCQKQLMKEYGATISFIDMVPMDIASQDILRKITLGEQILNQLPKSVYEYIIEHSIYRESFQTTDPNGISIDEIRDTMEEELPKKRYYHTIGVADTSACLAMRYGEDVKRARLAGMLHDCAKCLSDDEIYARCLEYDIPMTQTQIRQPFLLHGKLGAYYAKTRFGIEDEEIRNAISYHTTGRPDMTLLEKIVFIADYIEPTRKEIKGLDEIRKTVFVNLDQAIYLTLKNTLDYLKSQNDGKNEIDEMTVKAYEYYKDLMERGNKHESV